MGRDYPDGKVVTEIAGVKWSFSNQRFVEFIEDMEKYSKWRYSGESDLIFAEVKNGRLSYERAMEFHLDNMLRDKAIISVNQFFEKIVRIGQEGRSMNQIGNKLGIDKGKQVVFDALLEKMPMHMGDVIKQEKYKNELAVELAKCRTLNEKILHKEIFIYDEEFKIYKEIMPGFRKVSKSVLDYLVIIKLLVEKGIEDTTEGKEKIQKAYASAYEMTFAYYDLVMDEGIFIEEQTYVMLMNFFAHCEKILRINLNPENWKDMKWDEIIDNQINEENKITCHLRNKIRSC